MVSVFDPDLGDSTENGAVVTLAAQRLDQTEAVSRTVDSVTETTHLDRSYVLGPTAAFNTWLVRRLELRTGVCREPVLVAAREFLGPGDV